MLAFEAVLAQAVNATKRIDHPGIAGGTRAEGAPGRPGPQPGNQTPGRRAKSFRVGVRLHGTHPSAEYALPSRGCQ